MAYTETAWSSFMCVQTRLEVSSEISVASPSGDSSGGLMSSGMAMARRFRLFLAFLEAASARTPSPWMQAASSLEPARRPRDGELRHDDVITRGIRKCLTKTQVPFETTEAVPMTVHAMNRSSVERQTRTGSACVRERIVFGINHAAEKSFPWHLSLGNSATRCFQSRSTHSDTPSVLPHVVPHICESTTAAISIQSPPLRTRRDGGSGQRQ